MTEAEWLCCTDIEAMLDVVHGPRAARKLRLFAAACCRRAWHLIPPYHRRTVETVERFADGLASAAELVDAYQVSENLPGSFDHGDFDPALEGENYDEFVVPWPSNATCAAADCSAGHAAEDGSYWCARLLSWGQPEPAFEVERAAQAELLRDIFGNPFRTVSIDGAWLEWRERTIPGLARAAYEDTQLAAGRLAILADALEEAGCTSAEMLAHLRGPGPHVRGCWVIDLLLEKE